MCEEKTAGHIAAILTILIWATTYISTKVLLASFTPIEILIFRFIMGYIALWIACPKLLRTKNKQEELTLVIAGFFGICLYYLFENIALTYTMASNVGVIVSVVPFFTALLSHFFLKDEGKFTVNFFIGFVIAMLGIVLISFNGAAMQINPLGDFLALMAVVVWSTYSIYTKKISSFGYNAILVTRRTFFYGILFMLPALPFFDFRLGLERFGNPVNLFNIVFLGLGASATCFVSWNYAVKTIGAVKTSIYIYMVPVITVATSVIVLDEKITTLSAIGTVLTMAGLLISEGRVSFSKK